MTTPTIALGWLLLGLSLLALGATVIAVCRSERAERRANPEPECHPYRDRPEPPRRCPECVRLGIDGPPKYRDDYTDDELTAIARMVGLVDGRLVEHTEAAIARLHTGHLVPVQREAGEES